MFQLSWFQVLIEARIRLVSGLKRYFHGKRTEGLLSARGMQLLDYVCDAQIDHAHEPLCLWEHIEQYALRPLPWLLLSMFLSMLSY